MAQITRNMCEHIIKGFETKQGFPVTQWEAAQLAHAWIAREDERSAASTGADSGPHRSNDMNPASAPALSLPIQRLGSAMKYLRRIFARCEHKWEPVERYRIDSTLSGAQVGELWILCCSKCGDMTRRRLTNE